MDTLQTGSGDRDQSARYQEISSRQGRADRTAARAVDRRTGAAVVVHRQSGAGQAGADAARRSARLDHPVLAPVLDVWVDGGDAVVVQSDIAGDRLDDAGTRSAGDVVAAVLTPLAEGLDALHACGLAHGAVGCDTVVMARFGGGEHRPVLLGPPGTAADPSRDQRDLAAFALRLCGPAAGPGSSGSKPDATPPGLRRALAEAAGGTGREHPSCVALIDHLRLASRPLTPPATAGPPNHRWHDLWHQSPRIVPTVVLVLAVGLAAMRFLGRDGVAPAGRAWLVTSEGVAGGQATPMPIVAGAATATGEGLWLVAADASVSVTGDAVPVAPAAGGEAVVAATSRPDGGLWLVTADGGVHARAGAPDVAVAGPITAPIVDATAVPGTDGLWLLAGNGTVTVAAGGATAVPQLPPDPAAAAIAAHPNGVGGWRVSASGPITEFGGAPAFVDPPPRPTGTRVVRARPTPTGNGLWLLASNGAVLSVGDAAPLALPATAATAVDLVVAP